MILVLLLTVVAAAIAYGPLNTPLPVAIVIGIAAPFALSSAWLVLQGRNAPTNRLDPDDPRSPRFLTLLAAAYRQAGQPHLAAGAEEVAGAYAAGNRVDADRRFLRLSNVVARDPRSTRLISIWQDAWRESGR